VSQVVVCEESVTKLILQKFIFKKKEEKTFHQLHQ